MRYFFTLYGLRLKATLRSPMTLILSLLFLSLTLGFAWLLPEGRPAALTIGIVAQSDIGEEALSKLKDNGDYTVLAYEDVESLQKDLFKGQLHCGYRIQDEWSQPEGLPVTVYYTESTYLRPLLDQLVLSAYFEAKLPRMTEDYLQRRGLYNVDGEALLEKQRAAAKPMEVLLRESGEPQRIVSTGLQGHVQPLLYAVLVSLFIAAILLETLLLSPNTTRAQTQLQALTHHPLSSKLAPALAYATVQGGVLILADLGVTLVLGGNAYYTTSARISMFLLLAVVSAVLAALAQCLRKHTLLFTVMLPPWLLVSVLFSGALLDPMQFPLGLGILRFLSPAWYALQTMHFLS